MIAQHCKQEPWPAVLLQHFWRYWGHAGRNPNAWNPVVQVCRLFDARWLMLNPEATGQILPGSSRIRGMPIVSWESHSFGMKSLTTGLDGMPCYSKH